MRRFGAEEAGYGWLAVAAILTLFARFVATGRRGIEGENRQLLSFTIRPSRAKHNQDYGDDHSDHDRDDHYETDKADTHCVFPFDLTVASTATTQRYNQDDDAANQHQSDDANDDQLENTNAYRHIATAFLIFPSDELSISSARFEEIVAFMVTASMRRQQCGKVALSGKVSAGGNSG